MNVIQTDVDFILCISRLVLKYAKGYLLVSIMLITLCELAQQSFKMVRLK